ncbi:MAG TPA: AMP-binding protein [Ilumatobacter sp.]|nr:AMP-binding protein [Ilumatobacter sp.]
MTGWNFADVFETIADTTPGALAQQQGGRRFTWAEFDQRADGVAAHLLAAGLHVTADGVQDKVAQYLYNSPEYLESLFAAYKAGLATVNTNYRYAADELVYLWDNADAAAVVFHGTFADTIDPIRARVPGVKVWLWVDDGSGPCPDWATPYEPLAEAGHTVGRTSGPWGRSGDHLFILYTGGTTGMPKGVMWRQADVFGALSNTLRTPYPSEQDLALLAGRIAAETALKTGPRTVPAAPLMHGTGTFNALTGLMMGGSVTTLVGRNFDAVELLDTVEREQINSIAIVGDAFAKPMLRALDEEPQRWDISSLRVLLSSGVMFSAESKARLLGHNSRLIMVDSLGSSEALSMATSTTTAASLRDGATGSGATTAEFKLSPSSRVVVETPDGWRDVVPGSGEQGKVALRGYMPIGYYKDPDKTAGTFVMIDGGRYSIPGDFAEVLADGTVKLYGRGSQCINTGGEKVYPEEVEETLKLHPAVLDAAVVGLPDERFGEAITALVELHPDIEFDADGLVDHVKQRLARYKAPKAVYHVTSIGRQVNGKLDYRALKRTAESLASAG